ncbi:heterogeneous nuclear ribonucleoprotein A0-like [Melanaphis sacchari]|uniref:heterogeneous nuclear ribonucleoprotein A0-like n=1 Tax=Melanaphis sacchari TaxID=742174 RepID=UPI000DC13FF3|nr:heterogeneous nuclear ribonucleoprotein A0-like [Melanaphis sacchari]
MDANNEEHIRQLFVGGLSNQTTNQSLKDFFAQWGQVEKAVVKRYPESNRSRGFGFITYSKSCMVDKALSNRPHILDDHDVETKRYVLREEHNQSNIATQRKAIYITGINGQSENDLLKHFEQFGPIKYIKILITESDKKSRYGFVNFYDSDSAYKAIMNRTHLVAGKILKVNKAFDRKNVAGGYQGGSDRNKRGEIPHNETMGRYYNKSTGFKIHGNGEYGSNINALKYYGNPWNNNYPEYFNQGGGSYGWNIPKMEQPRTNKWGPNQFYGCPPINPCYTSNNCATTSGHSGYRSMNITGQQFIGTNQQKKK